MRPERGAPPPPPRPAEEAAPAGRPDTLSHRASLSRPRPISVRLSLARRAVFLRLRSPGDGLPFYDDTGMKVEGRFQFRTGCMASTLKVPSSEPQSAPD